MPQRRISAEDLQKLPGLRRKAASAITRAQPRTVLEALRLNDVGRKTTRALLEAGLITDPEGVQGRSRWLFDEPE